MAEGEASAVPHRGQVYLQTCPSTKGTLVVHKGQFERVLLPPGTWQLEFDDCDFGFLVNIDMDLFGDRDPSIWVSDVLTRCLYQSEKGKQFMMWSGPDEKDSIVSALQTELKTFQCGHLDVPIKGTCGTFKHEVVCFQLEKGGSRIHWKLSDLHAAAGLERGMKRNGTRWVYRRWASWASFMERAGFPVTLERSASLDEEITECTPEGRIHPWGATTTYGLLALSCRLSWSNFALKDETCRTAMAQYTSSLIHVLSGGSWRLALSLSRDTVWHPPMMWTDDDCVWLECTDGTLDMRPLREIVATRRLPMDRKEVLLSILRFTSSDLDDAMTLSDFMRILATHMHRSADVLRCFGEICFNVSLYAENILAPNHEQLVDVFEKQSKLPSGLCLRSDVIGASKHHRDQVLARYLTGCAELTKNHLTFSIAVDASRVGKKHLHLGLFFCPGGVAFWMVPQVCCPLGNGSDYLPNSAMSLCTNYQPRTILTKLQTCHPILTPKCITTRLARKYKMLNCDMSSGLPTSLCLRLPRNKSSKFVVCKCPCVFLEYPIQT
jgi:hypothetical protein